MKRLLQILSVSSLIYLLFLGIDAQRNKATVAELNSPAPLSEASEPLPVAPLATAGQPAVSKLEKPQKALPRRHWHRKSPSALAASAPQVMAPVASEPAFVEKINLPEPKQIKPQPRERPWEQHALRSAEGQCRPDRDCVPRGRNGVLLLGASFAANSPVSSWQGQWETGSYAAESPLMHGK